MVISHNDLCEANILFDTVNKKHVLIDLEYSGPNPLGMDVLNIFNELMFKYEGDFSPK